MLAAYLQANTEEIVCQVSGSNVVSVAEQVLMSILLLVRNFVPAHEMIERGDWQVSDIARNAYDLEGKVVGTLGAGRIGYRVLQRLVPFNCKELIYFDYNPLPAGRLIFSESIGMYAYDPLEAEKAVNARRVQDMKVRLVIPFHDRLLTIIVVVARNLSRNATLSPSMPPFTRGRLDLSTRSFFNTSRRCVTSHHLLPRCTPKKISGRMAR